MPEAISRIHDLQLKLGLQKKHLRYLVGSWF